MLRSEAVLPFVLFAALILMLSLYGLAASGHFPREHRKPDLASGIGAFIFWGSLLLAVASLMIGVIAAWRLLPWYAIVIGAGGPMLVAPLALQRFSDAFVDGRGALVAFAGASLLLAGVLALMSRMG
jgi:hypothetical protein